MIGHAWVGASGWSYPSWRPAFYPTGSKPDELLALYAAKLPAVELNATGYRLPADEQFERWREQVPDGFRFAVKAPPLTFRRPDVVAERVRALGAALGCVRFVVESARDDVLLDRLLEAFSGTRLALDLRHESWSGVEDALAAADAVRIGDLTATGDWRYLRFRDPPYDDTALTAIADGLRPLLAEGISTYAFFRHEDEPTAPFAALRVLELIDLE
jgi:uncharacterized protein YecE (DUF72 family)